MGQRVGGIILLRRNGELRQAKGAFSYNLGEPLKEAVVGADAVHGYKETPQAPMIEGAITDDPDLDLRDILGGRDETITLELANGKNVVLRDAWYAATGNVGTEEDEIEAKWEGVSAEEY